LLPKCAKTQLRTSANSKSFSGVIPRTLLKGEGRGNGREGRKGWGKEGGRVRGGEGIGRRRKGRERRGEEGRGCI
jgi:hypothetical protein